MNIQQTGVLNDYLIAGVNNIYQSVKLDLLYFCDLKWMLQNMDCLEGNYEIYSQDQRTLEYSDKINFIRGEYEKGFSYQQGLIHLGGNSVFQAMNVLILLGIKRILLLGLDLKNINGKIHSYKDHKRPLNNPSLDNYKRWILAFNQTVSGLKEHGIKVFNCSKDSALECYEKIDFKKAIQL